MTVANAGNSFALPVTTCHERQAGQSRQDEAATSLNSLAMHEDVHCDIQNSINLMN